MSAQFQGRYVKQMVQVVVGGLLTGNNVMTVSPPGWGKTHMQTSILKQIFGAGAITELPITPTMPVEKVTGALDVPHLVQTGQFQLNMAGTPYDPGHMAVHADELGRGNEATLDAMLYVTVRDRITVAATNFLPTDARFEALWSRFGLWWHLAPEELDARAIAKAQMTGINNGGMTIGEPLPTQAEIDAVRLMIPSLEMIECCSEVIGQLYDTVLAQGIMLDPRRITQWSQILVKAGFYYNGMATFNKVPKQAVELLRYAYPNMNLDAQIQWQQLVGSMADPIQTIIDDVMSRAYDLYQKIAGIADANERRSKAISELSPQLGTFQNELKQVSDPRAEEAWLELSGWMMKAVKGEKIARS